MRIAVVKAAQSAGVKISFGPAGSLESRTATAAGSVRATSTQAPPLLWVVLDEGVLRRRIGDRKVMRAQVEHLAEMADRSSVVIQVIPSEVGAHEGVNGSFVIADFASTPSIVYLETALTGLVVERPEDVAAVRLTYDTLRSEAMSRAASLELLQEVANSWT